MRSGMTAAGGKTVPRRPRGADWLGRIEGVIAQARSRAVAAVNISMVCAYHEIGRIIVEEEQAGNARSGYGEKLLSRLSERLTERFGKGWSVENLKLMRRFYLVYRNRVNTVYPIPGDGARLVPVPGTKTAGDGEGGAAEEVFTLSWSHYLKLMRIENPDERRFYEIEATQGRWSLQELQRQFDSSLYERLALSRDKAKVRDLARRGQVVERPEDVVKDPYVLEFLHLPEREAYTESELEQSLIDHLRDFLLELGKGFAFVGRQVRITFGERHFWIDLVFYNRLLRCFVLLDLKLGELRHQDIGQMQMYVNHYDRNVRLAGENPTIGILLCADKNDAIVELTLPEGNRQIFASQYEPILPSKEQLRHVLKESGKLPPPEGADSLGRGQRPTGFQTQRKQKKNKGEKNPCGEVAGKRSTGKGIKGRKEGQGGERAASRKRMS